MKLSRKNKFLNKSKSYKQIENNEDLTFIEKAFLSVEFSGIMEDFHNWEKRFGKMALLEDYEGFTNLDLLQYVFRQFERKYAQNHEHYGKKFKFFATQNVTDYMNIFEQINYITLLNFWITYSYFKHKHIFTREELSAFPKTKNKPEFPKKLAQFKLLHNEFNKSLEEFITEKYKDNEDKFIKDLKTNTIETFKKAKNSLIESILKRQKKLSLKLKKLKDEKSDTKIIESKILNGIDKTQLLRSFDTTIQKLTGWNHFKSLTTKFNQAHGIKILILFASVTAGVNLNKGNKPWPLILKEKIKDKIRKWYNPVIAESIIKFIPLFLGLWSKSGAGFQWGEKFFTTNFPYKTKEKTNYDVITVGLAANDFLLGDEKVNIISISKGYDKIINNIRKRNKHCPIIISLSIPPTEAFGYNNDAKESFESIKKNNEKFKRLIDLSKKDTDLLKKGIEGLSITNIQKEKLNKIINDSQTRNNNLKKMNNDDKEDLEILSTEVDFRNNRDKLVESLRIIGNGLKKRFKDVHYVEIPTDKLKKLDFTVDDVHPTSHSVLANYLVDIFFKIIKPIINDLITMSPKNLPPKSSKKTLNLWNIEKSKIIKELNKPDIKINKPNNTINI